MKHKGFYNWFLLTKRLLLSCLVLSMLFGCVNLVYALHPSTGVPASVSYVKKDDPRKIIIYIGDSRVMYCTCGPRANDTRTNFVFCFVNGGDVSVIDRAGGSLTSTVIRQIENYRSFKPVVVFNFGLNGNSNPAANASRIIRIYDEWIQAYPDLTFYVESIGPTILTRSSYSNKKVIQLNDLLEEEYEPEDMWLDTYSYIVGKGLIDSSGKGMKNGGYHYAWNTSRKEMKRIRKMIEKKMLQ